MKKLGTIVIDISVEGQEEGQPPCDAPLSDSIILSDLSSVEYEAFQAARIPYSGATGQPLIYGNARNGAYIATFMSEVGRAIRAIGWTDVYITARNGQWIAERSARSFR